MSEYLRIPLEVGDRVRLASPTGPTYTVFRVTPAAAYVKGGPKKEILIKPRELIQIEELGAKAARALLDGATPDTVYQKSRLAAHAAITLGMPTERLFISESSIVVSISRNSAVWEGPAEEVPSEAFSIDSLPDAGIIDE